MTSSCGSCYFWICFVTVYKCHYNAKMRLALQWKIFQWCTFEIVGKWWQERMCKGEDPFHWFTYCIWSKYGEPETLRSVGIHFKKWRRKFQSIWSNSNYSCEGLLTFLPVRNSGYHDSGDFCFLSKVIPCRYVFLHTIICQKDDEFIHVIRKISVGEIGQECERFVLNLEHPLHTEENVTRLFSENIMVDMYNRDVILNALLLWISW